MFLIEYSERIFGRYCWYMFLNVFILIHFAPPGHRLLKCFDVDGLCVTLTLSFGVVFLPITKNLEPFVWLAIIVFLLYEKKKNYWNKVGVRSNMLSSYLDGCVIRWLLTIAVSILMFELMSTTALALPPPSCKAVVGD